MFTLLFSDANVIFSVAIGIVFAIALLEVLGLVFGLSLMGLLDDVSPLDINADADISATGISPLLSWLSLDRLPLMIWLTLLFLCFGLAGYIINYLSVIAIGDPLSRLITVPVALIIATVFTARTGGFLARILPKNESSAVDTADFTGSVAIVTLGEARINSPAEARYVDAFEQAHYLMVEPMDEEERFVQGDRVILVSRQTRAWQATRYID
jgi:hypothetical protein